MLFLVFLIPISESEKARTFVRALLPLTPERLYYTS
jgi:hypothetical protein